MRGNLSSFGYKGIVNAKLKIGNKIVELKNHNEGTDALFKSFAKFLTGNTTSVVDTPQFIDLQFKEAGASTEWKSWLSKQLSLTGREYYLSEDPYGWAAKFSSTIVHSNLIQTITEDMDDDGGQFRLIMYSGTNEENPNPVDLAFLNVAAKDLARIVPGTQAIIEWSMMVTNID